MIIETFEYLLLISIVIIIISVVFVIMKSKWYFVINQIGILGVSMFYLMSFIMLNPYDNFADDLEIPKNIKFERPKTEIDTLAVKLENTFEIKNGVQPGIYEYYFWFKPKEKGELYLKVSEISKNIPLSEQQIKSTSLINVQAKDSLQLFHKEFTIYEGDGGNSTVQRFRCTSNQMINLSKK